MTYSFSGEKHAGKSGSEYTVRRLRSQEIPAALALTWEVFQQFEAPEYSQEGIDFFRSSLHDTQRIRAMRFYGAFDGDELVGTLCMRQPQHIGGFFVRAGDRPRLVPGHAAGLRVPGVYREFFALCGGGLSPSGLCGHRCGADGERTALYPHAL